MGWRLHKGSGRVALLSVVWRLQAADTCTVTSFWVGALLGSPAGRSCFVVYMETHPSRRAVGP